MKRTLAIVLIVLLLIFSEYFLLSEILEHQRVSIIAGSLLVFIVCAWGISRLSKKY
jgi:hypothetical protein